MKQTIDKNFGILKITIEYRKEEKTIQKIINNCNEISESDLSDSLRDELLMLYIKKYQKKLDMNMLNNQIEEK